MDEKQKLLDDSTEAIAYQEATKKKLKEEKMDPRASRSPTAMDRRCCFIAVPLILSCCLYFATRSTTTSRAAPTLIKAFIGFRHGSRAPGWTFESDTYKNSIDKFYPDGINKLTTTGKQESYVLGERLRERYDEFIGPIYKSEEVKVQTTLMDRTMMSGQIVMASFFPPQGYQVWNDELKWQPIPIYPEYIFNESNGASCPRYRLEAFKSLHIKFTELNPTDKESVMHVVSHSGESSSTKPYEVFARVWDTVYFHDRANLPLPEWLKSVYPEKMTSAALELVKGFIFGSEVQRQLLLYNYALALRDFFYSEDGKKLDIHSWHDLNNVALLKTVGIDADVYPEPASCVVVELHERRGQKYYEVYYYDSHKSMQPRQLEMECGMSCPIEEIHKLVDEFVVNNYKELCHTVNSTMPTSSIPKLKLLM